MRTNAMQALYEGAVAGLGIALLPDWLVAADVAAERLKILLGAYTTRPTQVSAISRTELRGVPRIKTFIEHLLMVYERETAEKWQFVR